LAHLIRRAICLIQTRALFHRHWTNRPPKRSPATRKSATHADMRGHARTFFLSDWVRIENKGSKLCFPADVAGSLPVAPAPFFLSKTANLSASEAKTRPVPQNVAISSATSLLRGETEMTEVFLACLVTLFTKNHRNARSCVLELCREAKLRTDRHQSAFPA